MPSAAAGSTGRPMRPTPLPGASTTRSPSAPGSSCTARTFEGLPAPFLAAEGPVLFVQTPEIVDNREFPGGVPEWLKGADCKSVGLAPTLVRIQPSPPLKGSASKLAQLQGLVR